MVAAENVRKLIDRLAPAAICDDCIVDKLNLTDRPHASLQARELAGQRLYERRKDYCSLCFGEKLVTRRLPGR